jgi:hypothetical protein
MPGLGQEDAAVRSPRCQPLALETTDALDCGRMVVATLLIAPALLLLVNDREIMGGLANSWRANLAGGTIVAAISMVGALYGVVTVFPNLMGK